MPASIRTKCRCRTKSVNAAKTILLVRPPQRIAADLAVCRAAGWTGIPFAPMETVPLADGLQQLALAWQQSDALFWVSPTAVDIVAQAGVFSGSLKTVKHICVGAGTAKVLQHYGIGAVHFPQQGNDSEAAAALPVWDGLPEQARVLLVCGEGGRDWLRRHLNGRGFHTQALPVYRRQSLAVDWQLFQAAAPTHAWVTSSEAARLLFAQAPAAFTQSLQSLLYCTHHARIAATLNTLGARHVRVGDTLQSLLADTHSACR